MTSTSEGDNQIPLRVAFDDEVQKKGKEDGIEVLHKRRPDVEDKKKRKEEKDRKKKKDKHKEKKENVKTEMEIRPVAASAVTAEPEKVIDDKPPANEGTDEPANDEKAETKADDGSNVPDVPVDNSKTVQSDEEPNEPKKSSLKKKQGEPRQDESSKRMMIRPATRRDFYDGGIEPDSRRNRADRGSNSSVISYKRQDRPARDPRHRKDVRDACTTTRDVLFRPCKFLGGKESCRDLCERRKVGKCDKGTLKGLDKWCDERPCEKERDRRRSREGRPKNTILFNSPDAQSTGSINEGTEGRGDDWEGNLRRRSRQASTDEIMQLKNDLTNLQTELDRLKEYLKTATLAAEKNKCTITRMKEHIRCNFPSSFPDFTRIREKLKNCNLMKMKLCREFKITTNRDRWKNDFECLMNELNNIRFELEKMRKDKS